jgi:hypothetical protein
MTERAPRPWLLITSAVAAWAACDAHPAGTGRATTTPSPDAGAGDAVFLTFTMGDASVTFADPMPAGEQVDGGVRYTVFAPSAPAAGHYLLELHVPEPGGPAIDCQPQRELGRPPLSDFEFTHIAGPLKYVVDRAAAPCGFTLTEAPAAPGRRGYLSGSFAATLRERDGTRVPLRGGFRVPTPFWWGRH